MFNKEFFDQWPLEESRYFSRILENHYRMVRARRYSDEIWSIDSWLWEQKADEFKASGRVVKAAADRLQLSSYMGGLDRLSASIKELKQVTLNSWQQDKRLMESTLIGVMDLGHKPYEFSGLSTDSINFPNS